MHIEELDLADRDVAGKVVELQRAAYAREVELVGSNEPMSVTHFVRCRG